MIIEYPRENAREIAHIFREHRFLTSCIESAISVPLGQFWVDDIHEPSVALIAVAFQFLNGNHESEEVDELLSKIPPGYLMLVPNKNWVPLLEKKWGDRLEVYQRFSFSPDRLDLNHLRYLKSQLPSDYSIRRIDLSIASEFPKLLESTIQSFYGTPERFIEKGLGFGIFHNGQLVSSAVSALPFTKSFEIQVDTLDDNAYRRKGLATSVCAALIEYAVQNGLIPNWDAANEPSKKLALKLGYCNPIEYSVYRWKTKPKTE
ncbi:MAG: GNAT family N-acetyltransferase [Candidatus Thorarchaeota archaeon]